jgi:hypothetical protein
MAAKENSDIQQAVNALWEAMRMTATSSISVQPLATS